MLDVAKINYQLGITEQFLANYSLPLQPSTAVLLLSGQDIYQRKQYLHPAAHFAWLTMRQAATNDDITLQLVSGFRSVIYQQQIIKNKLLKSTDLAQILQVVALPGYSEHHTGRAVDLTTPETKPLQQQFEDSLAFAWLQQNAVKFNFHLSYPKMSNKNMGIIYEPWHWCYHG